MDEVFFKNNLEKNESETSMGFLTLIVCETLPKVLINVSHHKGPQSKEFRENCVLFETFSSH